MDAESQKSRDRLFLALFALCISLLLVGLLLSFSSKEIGPLAEAHPQFEQMLQSTGADDSLPRPLLYLLFLPLFFIFGTVLLIAYTRPKGTRPTAIICFYILGYVFLLSSMLRSHDKASDALFLGFPEATAWMTYGVWFFPILFIVLFFLRYNDWVINAEEEKEFDDLVSSVNRSKN